MGGSSFRHRNEVILLVLPIPAAFARRSNHLPNILFRCAHDPDSPSIITVLLLFRVQAAVAGTQSSRAGVTRLLHDSREAFVGRKTKTPRGLYNDAIPIEGRIEG